MFIHASLWASESGAGGGLTGAAGSAALRVKTTAAAVPRQSRVKSKGTPDPISADRDMPIA